MKKKSKTGEDGSTKQLRLALETEEERRAKNVVEAIRDFARPPTVKGLLEFIGIVNFYHRFVPSAASIMQPLFQALKGKPKELQGDQVMISAFKLAKD